MDRKFGINLDIENLGFPKIQRGYVGDGSSDVIVNSKYIPLLSDTKAIMEIENITENSKLEETFEGVTFYVLFFLSIIIKFLLHRKSHSNFGEK